MTATLPFQRFADTIPPLTRADRCDRCGAEAFVVTRIQYCPEDNTYRSSDLMWCRHHYLKHQDRLLGAALAVRDESERID